MGDAPAQQRLLPIQQRQQLHIHAVMRITPMDLKVPVLGPGVKGAGREIWAVKEETHAARWGLLRGYSGKATKWVDFVVTDSTRRESCHSHRVVRNGDGVKGKLEKRVLGRVRLRELENRAGITRVGFRPSRCEV